MYDKFVGIARNGNKFDLIYGYRLLDMLTIDEKDGCRAYHELILVLFVLFC